jgi:hypothetical protein
MTGAAQRSSIILPVLLAVIGVALLATAVMLVPMIIRASVAQVSSTLPQPPAPADQAVLAPSPPPALAAPAGATHASPTPAGDAGAAATAPVSWTLTLHPKSYALDEASSAVLDQIAGYLQTHTEDRLALTGVNNPMRSVKRAKHAARRVKEALIESGVERYRMTVAGAQEDGARGLVVRAEIAEEAR